MTTVQNPDMMDGIGAGFPRTDQSLYSWGNAIAGLMALEGLRGLWPMSSVNSSGNCVDLSGQGQTLDPQGTAAFSAEKLIPYVELDGNSDYLEWIGTDTTTTFLELTDTPSSYSGQSGKAVMVKATEDGVEFGTPAKIISSLVINTDLDTVGDVGYEDCVCTGSITTTVTCTLVIEASFVFWVSNGDATTTVKLVNSTDTQLGTVYRATAQTDKQYSEIKARVTGVAAGTYTCNFMHTISNAAYDGYMDDKQILITAYPE